MRKTVNRIGLFLLVTVSIIAKGQTNQNYNGNFNSVNFRGTASYSYFQDNSEQRIFDGPFSFKGANGGIIISGNYKNNLKNGIWKINLTNVANTDVIMKYNITASATGSYYNGNLDGTWTLNRTKVISFSESGIASYHKATLNVMSYLFNGKTVDFSKSSTVTENSTANFKNNRFTGNFSYSVNGGKSKVTGQFDENGYFTGSWSMTYYQTGILISQTKTFQNGVLMIVKSKDNSTGEITTIYDKSNEVNEFFQNYNEEENYSKVGGRYLKLVEGKSNSSDDKFLEDAISIWFNNTSLAKSSYVFEIERGANNIQMYPERIIVINEEKTKQEIEITKEKERLEQVKRQKEKELEQERQKKIREFQSSDYGKLQEDIKKEMNIWLTKSDFESDTDYENRIKNEADSKLKAITEKEIVKSKKWIINRQYGFLQNYNVEEQTFDILLNNKGKDTLKILISKDIASQVYERFIYKDYEKTIVIIPLEIAMINNYWKITSALILFDGKWMRRGSKIIRDDYKIIGKNGNYTSEYDHYGPRKEKLVNLKNASGTSERVIYFYEWKCPDIINGQSLNFSFETLNIVLPK